MPVSLALNQTSSPLGPQADPWALGHIGVRSTFFPELSMKGNSSLVVAKQRVVNKGYELAVRRDSGRANPSGRAVQNLACRILQTALVPRKVRDREGIAVRSPVGVLHIFKERTRGSSRDWYACQSSEGGPIVEHATILNHE